MCLMQKLYKGPGSKPVQVLSTSVGFALNTEVLILGVGERFLYVFNIKTIDPTSARWGLWA